MCIQYVGCHDVASCTKTRLPNGLLQVAPALGICFLGLASMTGFALVVCNFGATFFCGSCACFWQTGTPAGACRVYARGAKALFSRAFSSLPSSLQAPACCLPWAEQYCCLKGLPAAHKLLSDTSAIMQRLISHFANIVMAVWGLHAMCFIAAANVFGRVASLQVLAMSMPSMQRHCSDTLFPL